MSTCPKCGESYSSARKLNGVWRVGWECGTERDDGNEALQSPACRIRELEQRVIELEAECDEYRKKAMAWEER